MLDEADFVGVYVGEYIPAPVASPPKRGEFDFRNSHSQDVRNPEPGLIVMKLVNWLNTLSQHFDRRGRQRRARSGPRFQSTSRPLEITNSKVGSAIQGLEDRMLLSNISIGQTVYETMGAAGDIDQFSFTLGSQTRVYIDGLSSSGNIVWSLEGPAGVAFSDHSLQGSSPAMNLMAGDYRLVF